MRQDQAIQIYQRTVDATIGPEQGAQWWAEVSAELDSVIAAPDITGAASIIFWWHADWNLVAQTPKHVADADTPTGQP